MYIYIYIYIYILMGFSFKPILKCENQARIEMKNKFTFIRNAQFVQSSWSPDRVLNLCPLALSRG